MQAPHVILYALARTATPIMIPAMPAIKRVEVALEIPKLA